MFSSHHWLIFLTVSSNFVSFLLSVRLFFIFVRAARRIHRDLLPVSLFPSRSTMASHQKNNNKDEDSSLAPSASASSITITSNPRRSDRLQTSRVVVESSSRVLHRTVSGGVDDAHSPKLSSRRSNSSKYFALNRQASHNPKRKSTTTATDARMTDEESDVDHDQSAMPPFEVSDDETNGVLRQASNERSRPTRTEVPKHFIEEPDGFRCNLCHEVSSLALSF